MSSNANNNSKKLTVCVIIGQDIEAITSAVVLASLGQVVHLYADIRLLEQQLQQYGFEHHLQALWQMYEQQRQIISQPLPASADELIHIYESASTTEGLAVTESPEAALYWLFLDSIKSLWSDDSWITAFNHSHQQTCPIIMSGIEPLGHISALAQRLQRAWVNYVPFVFLQDGEAYSSMLTPSLWLLGEKTPDSSHKLTALQPLMQHARAYHHADIATIEFARSSIMAMLATRVSFMNEMSRLADSHQVDIKQISRIMGLDERVGSSYLQAGWGFGGNTLPTELDRLQQSGTENSVDMPLLQAVMHINKDQKELIFRKFWQYFDGFIDHKTVMIWGGSYKSGSGRTAGSAIHPLLELLWSYNIRTLVYSDKAQAELADRYDTQPLLQLVDSPYQQLNDIQAIFIISWSPQDKLDIAQLNQQAMPIFDARNVLTPRQVKALVGDYVGIGRAK
jgi:UDPglucose 6-dehydrogenase